MGYNPKWHERPARPLDLRELMRSSATTAIYPDATLGTGLALLYLGAALAGEAGETGNHLKKVIRDDEGLLTEERRARIAHELGGVMWYWLRVCAETGLDPYAVIQANFAELAQRRENGTLNGDDTPAGRVTRAPAQTVTEALRAAGEKVGEAARGLRDAHALQRRTERYSTVDGAVAALMVIRPYFAEWHATCLGATCRPSGAEDLSQTRFVADTVAAVENLAHEHALRYHVLGVRNER